MLQIASERTRSPLVCRSRKHRDEYLDLVLRVRVRVLWQVRARSVEADAAAGGASHRTHRRHRWHHWCARVRRVAREHESEYAVSLFVVPVIAILMIAFQIAQCCFLGAMCVMRAASTGLCSAMMAATTTTAMRR